MKMWMVPFLFPLGLLGAVVSVSVLGSDERLLMFAGGIVLVVILWSLFSREKQDPGSDAHYWRLSDWGRGG